MKFQDHFSKQAESYARHRPRYPSELFAYLASVAPGHELAWDCGTGNGQAALGLAAYFKRIVATDASPQQIAQADPHERVEYLVEPAEKVSLAAHSVDLITVAVAVHWFELELFYQEVRRVLKPGGVLAVWTYHLPVIEPGIDAIIGRYYQGLAGYWPERFHYVDEGYRTLPFPLTEFSPPALAMQAEWDLDQLAGFVNSWSATQRYLAAQGYHPLGEIWPELAAAWGEAGRRRVIRWPLLMRLGRTG